MIHRLKTTGIAVLLLAFAIHSRAATRPNVLFVIADDLNDSVEGFGGHPQARTPNLDRFARSAVKFADAHVAVALCGPSRASLLSGLYPHTTGYYGWAQNARGGGDPQNPKHTFERPVLKDCTTLPQLFAQHGYTVFGTGKISHEYHLGAWMFDNADGTRHWAFSPVTQGPGPSDGRTLPNGSLRGAPTTDRMPRELARIGSYFGPLSEVPDIPPDPKTGAPGYRGWMEWGQPFRYVDENDRDLMSDEKSANYAIEVLRQEHECPFFLAVGFCKPHTPLIAPKKYFDLFAEVEIELPPYRENDLEDCVEELWKNTVPQKYFKAVRDAGIDTWKEWIRAYLACTAFMDDQFGRVLSALESSPYADNTIVIFVSDHGMHLGEKDMLAKMTLWHESTHVPMLIRVPGSAQGGRVCDRPVSVVDLYPTLVECCDLPAPEQELDGVSLRPMIEDPETKEWSGPGEVLVAWMGRPTPEQREHPYVKAEIEHQHFALVTDRYRYIRAAGGGEELYDLANDPNEWTNLASDPEQRPALESLRATLDARLATP
ncbi:sulfatase [Kiritimatiella glycovorans]|uniref:Arylsulfatase n=1 Tax=Kiritimatiella glycovorans TaxID=1307763 RepID=A0A0G3EI29_9BACT|nr:sulfatase [Kiritimatiella glycovorans]AKJ64470.1 Arylsulfatase [Kiritimatiella glycovorans]